MRRARTRSWSYPTTGRPRATFKQRNGYDLHALVERSLSRGIVKHLAEGDENHAIVRHAIAEATGRAPSASSNGAGEDDVMVLASGNLGLIYLMEEQHRLSMEEIDERHPHLLDALHHHPHIGFLMVRSREHGPVVLGPRGTRYLSQDRVEGEDPLAPSRPTRLPISVAPMALRTYPTSS